MNANWINRTLFHGDNLDFMRAMNSESVDLIATDPPFNKSRDFHATPDSLAEGASFQDRWSWEKDVHQEWVDQITDDHPALMEAIESAMHAHSGGMGAYMCFMAVRLLAMRRILKPTGSIYLHCDPTASHYLKAVMDAIFGRKNFRNEIIWCYGIGSRSKKQFARKHDVILYYSKSSVYGFNADDVRLERRKTHMKIETDSEGNEWQVKTDKKTGKVYKYKVSTGALCPDWWTDIQSLNREDSERTGYPTQKPLTLYERIIKASSNEGDIVLDPFAGCATTCVASERINRQWVGIDIWDKAHEVVIKRLHDEVGLFGEVHYTQDLPARTDEGDTSAPYLKVKKSIPEPPGRKMSRAEMYDILLSQQGTKCQGCDRKFDDPRYLELDHNVPRADGGINHISNRILLCGPCNRLKSHTYTLSGLRRENRKRGFMRN